MYSCRLSTRFQGNLKASLIAQMGTLRLVAVAVEG